MKTTGTIELLLAGIEEGYSARAWHGTNLRGSLRGLSPEAAARRPAKGRHNIWEIAVHCAYWKYVVRRRILGERRGSFPLAGSNWFRRPVDATEAAWRDDLRLLGMTHAGLVELVGRLDPADLGRTPAGSKVSTRAILSGIAMHDVYHAGQIQMIKRLTE